MPKGLVERLQAGEDVLVAEGFLFELERRGYLKAGGYVPEVVIEHPDKVRSLHEEFAHAGSDVCLAFTYYGHREKLRLIGREKELEKLNREALRIARQVANNTGTLMAGNICNTTVYEPGNAEAIETAKSMFKEQIQWAVGEGADYILGETFHIFEEARLAMEAIKEHGNGLPGVITLSPFTKTKTFDEVPYPEAFRKLQEGGACVIGFNCGYGPRTTLPLIKEIMKTYKGPVAAVPVPYRTYPECPRFQMFRNPENGNPDFPTGLPAWACRISEITEFAKEAKRLGVQYAGLCCGNAPHYQRALAEGYGRSPPASRYTTDLSLHYTFGNKKAFKSYYCDKLKSALETVI